MWCRSVLFTVCKQKLVQTLAFSQCYYVTSAYGGQDFVASVLHNCATLILVIVTIVSIYVSLTQIITKLVLLITSECMFRIDLLCPIVSTERPCFSLGVRLICPVSMRISLHIQVFRN
jgi:hypothetical protein